jgi:DNA-binding transcriptional MerR regulator
MFKIGDFSRLTRVPIKTLRHYDEIELFKPAQVDPFTGYRYYTFDSFHA